MVEDITKNTYYISQRAANTIIADITPYRISSEALAVINHFLDEFLFLLVESSCSLSLENIKLSILNVLPTHLGKNSIKEADFELKTFLESGNFDKNLEKTVELLNPYPIQRIFEQFRIKCKYYSTLSEQNFSINDRDPKTMPGLHESDGIYISPSLAIYMTAILEYVGEHILILVANALKQQGDVTIAKANEVYLALTDSQVLPAFQRTSLREKMEETLSILLKSQDCNITLSPTSPMTPLSANITDGNITFRSLGIIAPSSPISDDDFTSRFSEGGISPSSMTNVDNNTPFRSPPNSPTKVDNTTFRSPPNSPTKVTFRSPPSSPTKVDNTTFRSPPNSPTKVAFRSPPSSPTKVGDIISRSPEATSPSSPIKGGIMISQSPKTYSPTTPTTPTTPTKMIPRSPGAIPPSPIKQNFHNEIGGGPRKGSVDSALWNRSSASQNQIFGRTSLESKNNIGIHYSKHKLKERDIKSISSLDEIDKAKSFEHLISNNQNLTLKVSLTSNRMKTIETQKQEEPRKYEPREPVARERLIPPTKSESQNNEEDDDDDLDEFINGGKKKPKESLFEFLKNTDPEEIFNKPTGKLKRKDSKLDLLQKRLFANKSASSSIGRSTTGPSYPNGRPRHIPLIPSGRLSTSEIRSSSNNTNTLHHSKSLDHLSTIYNSRSKENNNIYDNLYNRQKPRSESLKFNEDDYSIINYERPSNRFDTQDLIDFLNTSTPPNDATFTEKKEKIFTKLLSKLRISSKGKYNNGSQRSNNNKSVNKPKYIKIQIPEILRKEETQEQKDNNHRVQENYVIKSVKLNPLPVRKSSLKSLKGAKHDDKNLSTNNLLHTPLSNNDSISKSNGDNNITIVNYNNNGDVSKSNIINNDINIVSTTNDISCANNINNTSNNYHSNDIIGINNNNINNNDVDIVNDKVTIVDDDKVTIVDDDKVTIVDDKVTIVDDKVTIVDDKVTIVDDKDDRDIDKNNNDDDTKESEQFKQQTISYTTNNSDVVNDKVIIVEDKDDEDIDNKNNNNDDDTKEFEQSEQSKQPIIDHTIDDINDSDVVNDKDIIVNDDKDDQDMDNKNNNNDDYTKEFEQSKQQIINYTVDNFLHDIIFMEPEIEESNDESEQNLISEFTNDELLVVEWLLIGSELVL